MKRLVVIFGFALLPFLSCDGDDCDHGCDKLRDCGLKTSGFSCNEDCKQDSACAECVLESSCDEIANGACAAECPGANF